MRSASASHVRSSATATPVNVAATAAAEVAAAAAAASSQRRAGAQAEVDLLAGCQHPHIIRYLGTEVDRVDTQDGESVLYIFSEWVPGGSVHSVIERFGRLSETVAAKYTRCGPLPPPPHPLRALATVPSSLACRPPVCAVKR